MVDELTLRFERKRHDSGRRLYPLLISGGTPVQLKSKAMKHINFPLPAPPISASPSPQLRSPRQIEGHKNGPVR
jgi:hypothetical protein